MSFNPFNIDSLHEDNNLTLLYGYKDNFCTILLLNKLYRHSMNRKIVAQIKKYIRYVCYANLIWINYLKFRREVYWGPRNRQPWPRQWFVRWPSRLHYISIGSLLPLSLSYLIQQRHATKTKSNKQLRVYEGTRGPPMFYWVRD